MRNKKWEEKIWDKKKQEWASKVKPHSYVAWISKLKSISHEINFTAGSIIKECTKKASFNMKLYLKNVNKSILKKIEIRRKDINHFWVYSPEMLLSPNF